MKKIIIFIVVILIIGCGSKENQQCDKSTFNILFDTSGLLLFGKQGITVSYSITKNDVKIIEGSLVPSNEKVIYPVDSNEGGYLLEIVVHDKEGRILEESEVSSASQCLDSNVVISGSLKEISINIREGLFPNKTTYVQSLSEIGSDRATAYNMSTKIIKHNDNVYFTYLAKIAGVFSVRLVKYSSVYNQVLADIEIGTGRDNHVGATLVLDRKRERILTFYGAHGDELKYREIDLNNFSVIENELIIDGPLTYPSAAIDSTGQVYLLARKGGYIYSETPWSLELYTISTTGEVNNTTLFISNEQDEELSSRYVNYFQQIEVSNGDTLHVSFLIHERPKGLPQVVGGGLGYSINYMHSLDSGKSWGNVFGQSVAIPSTIFSSTIVDGIRNHAEANKHFQSLGMAYSSNEEKVYLTTVVYDFESSTWDLVLFKSNSNGWEKNLIGKGFYSPTISIGPDGSVFIVTESGLTNEHVIEAWSSKAKDIQVLKSYDYGSTFSISSVIGSKEDIDWLASFEKSNSSDLSEYPLFFMYTIGNGESTEVVVERID
jgi:hypothetical protein